MSTVSTFGAFTTARLGIYASQKALEVTGNNIANINTFGYSRQALNQVSLRVGSADRYQSANSAKVGSGVLCTGVSQLRDPYLDIRYRNELTSVGAMDSKLGGLEDLASIFDEVGKGKGDGVIEKQLTDLIKQMSNMVTQGAGKDNYDTLVRSSASVLASLFNTYANKLGSLQEKKVEGFKQDLTSVNNILEGIRDLNASIRNSDIYGGGALELRDQRNVLIDQLSQYMKIDVTYEKEDIGSNTLVEKLVIKLGGNGQGNATERATLVDGVYAADLSIVKEQIFDANGAPVLDGNGNPTYRDTPNFDLQLGALLNKSKEALEKNKSTQTILDTDLTKYPALVTTNNGDGTETVTLNGILKDTAGNPIQDADGKYTITSTTFSRSTAVAMGDNDLYGSIQSTREILTEKGEYVSAADLALDPKAGTKRGIPYYQSMLDSLANKFTTVLNAANKMDENVIYQKDAGGNFLLDASNNKILKPEYSYYKGGNLFSNSGNGNDDGTPPITAGNISISKDWNNGSVRMLQSTKPHDQAQSTDNSNLTHILYLMTSDQKYAPKDTVAGASDTVFFTGNFQEMLTNTSSILANDTKTTTTMLENYSTSATSLFSDRDSVMGVDLNDEAMGLMQYQKSYSAACRLMTTLDQVLDKLINGTAV